MKEKKQEKFLLLELIKRATASRGIKIRRPVDLENILGFDDALAHGFFHGERHPNGEKTLKALLDLGLIKDIDQHPPPASVIFSPKVLKRFPHIVELPKNLNSAAEEKKKSFEIALLLLSYLIPEKRADSLLTLFCKDLEE